ncbi:MAG TPA: hypothetical protein DIW37_10350 [Chryseobacterium sp.]|nr:hypothetical protein [Chryseobacterium sp.]
MFCIIFELTIEIQSVKYKVMKKSFFRFLNTINKAILPKLSDKDPSKLTKIQKGILAYRYFVLINSMD